MIVSKPEKPTRWFIHTTDEFTNTVILELKKNRGTHDEDFIPNVIIPSHRKPVSLWKASYDEIATLFENKKRKSLKFIIYRETDSMIIHRWELPIRGDEMKIILPLIPMSRNIEEYQNDWKNVMDISFKHSSAYVSYVPVLVVLSMIAHEHHEGGIDFVRKGFKVIFTLLLRGAFNEVHLYGNCISSGMEKIILVARVLGIPIIAKTAGTEKDLRKILQ